MTDLVDCEGFMVRRLFGSMPKKEKDSLSRVKKNYSPCLKVNVSKNEQKKSKRS